MKKTSVYLTEGEATGLRQASRTTGRSHADLIREGVRMVIARLPRTPRTFHSMGLGRAGGERVAHWDDEELFREVMGDR